MKILAITILSILVLGFLFVQWANKPEQVEALTRKRKMEAIQKMENEKKEVQTRIDHALIQKEIESKKANMTLAINENFANNRFERLDFKYDHIDYFKLEKKELNFSGMLAKGQNAQDYFMSSQDDFDDFIAETQIGIWGENAYAGIFWDAKPNNDKNPEQYQAAYASPTTLYVEAGDTERFSLGGLISSENNQLLRVERFGKNVKVSVNGRTLFDEQVVSTNSGKVGIFIGHRGGTRNMVQSISIGIKYFKVWQ
ncbi:hypothetical protein [Spirosoma migulaei]